MKQCYESAKVDNYEELEKRLDLKQAILDECTVTLDHFDGGAIRRRAGAKRELCEVERRTPWLMSADGQEVQIGQTRFEQKRKKGKPKLYTTSPIKYEVFIEDAYLPYATIPIKAKGAWSRKNPDDPIIAYHSFTAETPLERDTQLAIDLKELNLWLGLGSLATYVISDRET